MARSLPLTGVRVLDLTTNWAGPQATAALADLGAQVIKIEAIQRLDGWRGALAGHTGSSRVYETSPVFNGVNRNKLGITLNLACSEGVAVFRRLLIVSDIVCESYSSRVMGHFGLDYSSLCKLQPDIIMASLSGFGRDGPWRDYVAYAATVEATSGLIALTGYPGGPPLMSGTILGDPVPGLFCAYAAVSALDYRRRTGRGQWIDSAQVETITWGITDALVEAQRTGRSPGRRGNYHPTMAPHDTYRCKGEDEWVAIAISSDAEWVQLCDILGCPDLATHRRYLSARGRQRHGAELRAPIQAWTRPRDKFQVAQILQEADIAASPVQNPADLLRDPHLKARRFFQRVDRREVGVHPYPALPPVFTGVSRKIRSPAPCLGEHNRWVLADLMGLSEHDVAELAQAHVIGTEPIGALPLR